MNLRVKLTMQSCFSCANYNRSQKAWDTALLPIHGLLVPSPSLPPTQCYADPSNIVPLFQHSFFWLWGLGVGEVGKFNNDIPLKNVRHQLAFCQVSQGFLARVETYTLYDLFH